MHGSVDIGKTTSLLAPLSRRKNDISNSGRLSHVKILTNNEQFGHRENVPHLGEIRQTDKWIRPRHPNHPNRPHLHEMEHIMDMSRLIPVRNFDTLNIPQIS